MKTSEVINAVINNVNVMYRIQKVKSLSYTEKYVKCFFVHVLPCKTRVGIGLYNALESFHMIIELLTKIKLGKYVNVNTFVQINT